MIPKLVIGQNIKLTALFVSDILKEEFNEILSDGQGQRWGSSEIVNFKPFKSNEILAPNKSINLYLAMGTSIYWSSIPFLEITLFYEFTNRHISSCFNDSEYTVINFNGTTLKDIILNFINSWKLMNLK